MTNEEFKAYFKLRLLTESGLLEEILSYNNVNWIAIDHCGEMWLYVYKPNHNHNLGNHWKHTATQNKRVRDKFKCGENSEETGQYELDVWDLDCEVEYWKNTLLSIKELTED